VEWYGGGVLILSRNEVMSTRLTAAIRAWLDRKILVRDVREAVLVPDDALISASVVIVAVFCLS
jgi:hypothetical protein